METFEDEGTEALSNSGPGDPPPLALEQAELLHIGRLLGAYSNPLAANQFG